MTIILGFNSSFAVSSGYSTLKRWTRKVDIFAHDIILIPVHLGMHWCLAVVNFKVSRLL